MGNTPEAIVIRDIERISEMREVENLQKEIWGVEDRDVFPALALIPLLEVGAILIGAFHQNRMVGFVFGFPGISNGQTIIHSDMLGVKVEYRSMGLGYLLKLAQRDKAIAAGIKTISWTFDPLQSRNAHLNFARLGVIADRYEIDFYGETSSFLHQTGTDRLWLTWQITSERVDARVNGPVTGVPELVFGQIPAIVSVEDDLGPLTHETVSGERVLIEIPMGLGDSAKADVASRWRVATRTGFTRALRQGYVVEEFYRNSGDGKGAYLLRRR